MPVPKGATDVIRKAEGEIRTFIQEALEQGRYQEVTDLAALADGLARLHSSGGSGETPVALEGPQGSLHAAAEERKSGRSTSRGFPRFQRDAGKLIKIAWSKRNRAEYEHRAPRELVDILIDRIRKKKGEGAKFEAPEIMPLKDKANREVPSYQAYLALAWLRHEGVIVKYGRDHYALKPGLASRERIAELWEALPQK